MKLTKLARGLINLIALLMLVWIGYVVYASITDTGLWKYIADLITTDATGRYSPMGAFAICLLAGILPLMGCLFLVVWLSNKFSRDR